MPSPQLSNYLRSSRKRLALSQGEVAFLLGHGSSGQVSRYERFEHMPSLETALVYEVILKIPLSEIFGGMYQKAEREVAERAQVLASRIGKQNAVKCKLLAKLIALNNEK